MKTNTTEIALHLVCVAVIAGCYALAYFAFPDDANVRTVLVGAATLLYGKLCWKPANPVLARILQAMAPAEVTRLSMKPPAAPPPVPPAVTP